MKVLCRSTAGGGAKRRSVRHLFVLSLLLGILVPSTELKAQASTAYFYHGYPYGSEATYNPIATILNGGYGILQMGNRDKRPLAINYHTGWDNLWRNLLHPLRAIETFGWKKFVTTEIVPTSPLPRRAQYVPNYQNHVIGGGMTYRMLQEWYDYHGYARSTAWALGTLTVYHFLNEVVENNAYVGINVDPIADILVFNPLGVLLFSSERVTRFFAGTLQLRDWSYFPTFNPWTGTLENNGQNFSIKWRLPGQKSWSLFYAFGLNGIVGLSYRREDGSSISGGFGFMANKLRKANSNRTARSLTVDLVWNAGLFYDRHGSLMASLLLSGSRAYKARATVYPGLIRFFGISPGLFAAVGKSNELIFGLQVLGLPVGLSLQN